MGIGPGGGCQAGGGGCPGPGGVGRGAFGVETGAGPEGPGGGASGPVEAGDHSGVVGKDQDSASPVAAPHGPRWRDGAPSRETINRTANALDFDLLEGRMLRWASRMIRWLGYYDL